MFVAVPAAVEVGRVMAEVENPLSVVGPVRVAMDPYPLGKPVETGAPVAVLALDVEVEFELALALAWKASKLLSAGALTAKTIPV